MHKCLLCGSIERVKVSVSRGDLTTEKVDAIVNASNESLLHEGGLAKTILDKGGKIIGQESNKIIKKRKSLKEGQAVLTKSGNQPPGEMRYRTERHSNVPGYEGKCTTTPHHLPAEYHIFCSIIVWLRSKKSEPTVKNYKYQVSSPKYCHSNAMYRSNLEM